MAPKKTENLPSVNGHHQMSWRDLAEADDLASTITVDAFLGFKTHKMTQSRKKFKDAIIKFRENPDYEMTFATLTEDEKIIKKSWRSDIRFKSHIFRYLLLFDPRSGIEIKPCYRYASENHIGAAIFSTKLWLALFFIFSRDKGCRINTLIGCIAELNLDEEKAFLKDKQNDFSVMYSSRKNCSQLWLGPASYVNHDCKPNCKFTINCDGDSRMSLEALNPIKPGDEIYIHYGSHFFDTNNALCECFTCELLGQSYFSNKSSQSLPKESHISSRVLRNKNKSCKLHFSHSNTVESLKNLAIKSENGLPTQANMNGFLPKGVSTGLARKANSKGYSLRHTFSRLERVKAKLFADTLAGELSFNSKASNDENVDATDCGVEVLSDVTCHKTNMPRLQKIVINISDSDSNRSDNSYATTDSLNYKNDSCSAILLSASSITPPPPKLEPAPSNDNQSLHFNAFISNGFPEISNDNTFSDNIAEKVENDQASIVQLVKTKKDHVHTGKIKLTYCDRLLLDEAKRLTPQSDKRIPIKRKRTSSPNSLIDYDSDKDVKESYGKRSKLIRKSSISSQCSSGSTTVTTSARYESMIDNVNDPSLNMPVLFNSPTSSHSEDQPNIDSGTAANNKSLLNLTCHENLYYPSIEQDHCSSIMPHFVKSTHESPEHEGASIPDANESCKFISYPQNFAGSESGEFPSEESSVCSEVTIPLTYDMISTVHNTPPFVPDRNSPPPLHYSTAPRTSPSPPILKPVTPQHINNTDFKPIPRIDTTPRLFPESDDISNVNKVTKNNSFPDISKSNESLNENKRITVTLKRFGSTYYCVRSQ